MFRSATIAFTQVPLRTARSSRVTTAPIRRSLLGSKQTTSPFSAQPKRLQHQTSSPKKPAQSSPSLNGEPETPTFSLDGLGISPNMKKAIIGVICIFGTMETYTYYIWIKNRWFPDEKEEGKEAQA